MERDEYAEYTEQCQREYGFPFVALVWTDAPADASPRELERHAANKVLPRDVLEGLFNGIRPE